MRLGIQYDTGNGPQTVIAGPPAFIGWELANGTKASRLGSDGIGMADISELAWRALYPKGTADAPPLEVWRNSLIDIQPVDTADPM